MKSNSDVVNVVRQDNDKVLRRSIESVIDSMCSSSNSMVEKSNNSCQSNVSHQSSSASGKGSRTSSRSNSSASLPSAKNIVNKTQRRRISIQNEDVPYIKNKDALPLKRNAVSNLPIKEPSFHTSEGSSCPSMCKLNSANNKIANQRKDNIKETMKTIKHKAKFKTKAKKITKKEKQKFQLAINDALSLDTNTKDLENEKEDSYDKSSISNDLYLAPNKRKNQNISKTLLKSKDTENQKQKINLNFVAPAALLKKLGAKKTDKTETFGKSFITPIAARVKRLNRNIKNKKTVTKDNAISPEQSLEQKRSIETEDHNELNNYKHVEIDEQQCYAGTSSNSGIDHISEKPRSKSQSFVTAVFAAKKANSKKSKISKNPSSKSLIVKKSNSKQSPDQARNKDDVVTKYLKKFKDTISPKKNVNQLLKSVKETQNSSPVTSKGKKMGRSKSAVYFTEKKPDTPNQQLPKINKNSSKKGSSTSSEEDDEVFKRPEQPVSQEKEAKSKKSKSSSKEEDNQNSFRNITNSKPGKRSSLRSSRR